MNFFVLADCDPYETNFLFRTPRGKTQPPVQHSRSLVTASAGLYPKIGGCSLNYIAQSDLIFRDKSGQSHSVNWLFGLI